MRTHATRSLPARLERTQRRFELWRRARHGRSRIPERLWSSAVKAAGRYGLNQTARVLRLDYYTLKQRTEAAGSRPELVRESAAPDSTQTLLRSRAVKPRGGSGVTTFLELAPPTPGGAAECILELERPGGAKMRVHLKGVEAPDLAALSRSFWSTTT